VPRVDAGILRLQRRDAPLLPPRVLPEYRAFVGLGFGGVGGSLGASLRQEYPARRVAAAFRAAGLNPATVVGYVHPAQWIALFAALHREEAVKPVRRRASCGT
jgi:23S rRNA (adenine-N6)-dimethyltransferase